MNNFMAYETGAIKKYTWTVYSSIKDNNRTSLVVGEKLYFYQ